MRLWSRAAAAGLGLLIALAGCASGVDAEPTLVAGGPAPPSELQVTCHADRTEISAATVVVQRDGVHVRVTDSSGRRGTYLNYLFSDREGRSQGGGDAVRAGTSSRVLPIPPGAATIGCSYDSGQVETPRTTVQLEDPDQHFRTTTLADLGCRSSGSPSWAIGPGRGSSADAAVRALLAQSPSPAQLRPEPAPIGYPAASVTTYLVERDGHPWATAVVTRDRGQFTASMDVLC